VDFAQTPQFSSSPGLALPAPLKAFEDPETPRAEIAELLAQPVPRRILAFVPPRIVAHANFTVDDLVAAAAIPGSLGEALLANAGVLLRLVELYYAGADDTATQRTFVASLAPYVGHDNLLHLTLHHSPAVRSFTRDVLRVLVQELGDREGLRQALRFSGDYGILVPADHLEGAVLDLTSIEDMEPVDEAAAPPEMAVFLSNKSNLVWVVDLAAQQAQSERGRVALEDGWWVFSDGQAQVQTRAGQATPEQIDLMPLTVSLHLGLLRLSEPWYLAGVDRTPGTEDWRQIAGEGAAALIKAGVSLIRPTSASSVEPALNAAGAASPPRPMHPRW
jgi:hypothetical protein